MKAPRTRGGSQETPQTHRDGVFDATRLSDEDLMAIIAGSAPLLTGQSAK